MPLQPTVPPDSADAAPPPNPFPNDFTTLNRLNATAVLYWSAILFVTAVLTVGWLAKGPDNPFFGLMLATGTFSLGPGIAIPVFRRLPERLFHVPPGERVLHRILGVGLFAALLDRSGYNRRFVHSQWGFSANRAGLRFRELAARGGASAHGACFLIHLILGGLALRTGHAFGAVWILVPGMILHLYPTLLQRSISLRIQTATRRLEGRGSNSGIGA